MGDNSQPQGGGICRPGSHFRAQRSPALGPAGFQILSHARLRAKVGPEQSPSGCVTADNGRPHLYRPAVPTPPARSYRPPSPKWGLLSVADTRPAHPSQSPKPQRFGDKRELCFRAAALHVEHQAQTTLRRIPREGSDAPQDHPKDFSRDRFLISSGSIDDAQVDKQKPLRRTITDNHGEHEISDVVNNSEDDTRYADTQIEVFSAGTAANSRTRFDCENGASAYQKQGSQNFDEASSSQKLNIEYSLPQNPESKSPSSRSDSRRTRTSKNGTTSLQIQDSQNVEECHDTQLCVSTNISSPQVQTLPPG